MRNLHIGPPHTALADRSSLGGAAPLARLGTNDVLQLGILALLAILQLVLWSRLPISPMLFIIYGVSLVILIALVRTRPHINAWAACFDQLIFPILLMLIVFQTIGYSIPEVNGAWFEPLALAFDSAFFGMSASGYLERFYYRPVLEVMHLFYMIYYFLPLSVVVMVYARRSPAQFQHALRAMGLAFYLCFILYFVFPVVGPYRNPVVYQEFTQDILAAGGPVTRFVRWFVDKAELNSYDSFPSAHTSVTLMTVWLAYRYDLAIWKWYLLPAGMILVSTVFLRYHYVLDILAGVLVVPAAYWLSSLAGSRPHAAGAR